MHKIFEPPHIYMVKEPKNLHGVIFRVVHNLGHFMDTPNKTGNDRRVPKLN